MNQNKKNKVIRAFFETLMRDGDFTVYDEIIAEDVKGYAPASWAAIHPNEINNRIQSREINEKYLQGLSFKTVNIHELILIENRAFVRWDTNGIHQGTFYGFHPTYQPFSISGQTTFRLDENLQIIEVWQAWDMLGLLNQIGWEFVSNELLLDKNFKKIMSKTSKLSQKEKICLKFLVHGKTAKETAAELFLSHRTIEHYFENIKNKMDCANKRELFVLARQLEKYKLL